MTVSFPRRRSGRLGIVPTALAVVQRHLQHRDAAPEAGGLLLGRWIKESNDVIIDVATEPDRLDKRSRFRFSRARRPAQALVDQHWKNSHGTENYLGDWHTHPEESPEPSCLDTNNWLRLINRTQFEGDALFFLIAGTVDFGVWECCRNDWWGPKLIGRHNIISTL